MSRDTNERIIGLINSNKLNQLSLLKIIIDEHLNAAQYQADSYSNDIREILKDNDFLSEVESGFELLYSTYQEVTKNEIPILKNLYNISPSALSLLLSIKKVYEADTAYDRINTGLEETSAIAAEALACSIAAALGLSALPATVVGYAASKAGQGLYNAQFRELDTFGVWDEASYELEKLGLDPSEYLSKTPSPSITREKVDRWLNNLNSEGYKNFPVYQDYLYELNELGIDPVNMFPGINQYQINTSTNAKTPVNLLSNSIPQSLVLTYTGTGSTPAVHYNFDLEGLVGNINLEQGNTDQKIDEIAGIIAQRLKTIINNTA